MTAKIHTVESIWSQLPDLGAICTATVSSQLAGWEDLIVACLEAGMLAPMVQARRSSMCGFSRLHHF